MSPRVFPSHSFGLAPQESRALELWRRGCGGMVCGVPGSAVLQGSWAVLQGPPWALAALARGTPGCTHGLLPPGAPGKIGLRAPCHLVKATGKSCFMEKKGAGSDASIADCPLSPALIQAGDLPRRTG